MFTYLILTVSVFAVLGLIFLGHPINLGWRRLLLIMAVLLIFTAVFDSLLISLDIVRYHTDHILGVYVGRAPIEDFAYTVAAAVMVPYLWERLK